MASYWLKIATFSFSLFSGPAGGDLVGISWRCLMLVKLEWLGYRMVRKLWRYVKPFSYNTSVLRTDERTDRRTDRQNCYINIARQHQCDLDRFNVSPLRGEKPKNWPVSKNKSKKSEKHHISSSHADVRRAISTKFCTAIEVVLAIILGLIHFWVQSIIYRNKAAKFGKIM